MKFNVITPLARFENFTDLVDMLEPKGIEWHIITDEGTEVSINVDQEKYPWIHFYICPNNGIQFFERCNYAINWFIDTQEIKKNEIYCILNDDDGYEPDFFLKLDAIENIVDTEVVIVSMERGHRIPSTAIGCRAHPPSKLWAVPENLRVGAVGVEQIILKGEILSKFRIPLLNDGDGRFIVAVASEYTPLFAPEINVWFNYFEPERWDK